MKSDINNKIFFITGGGTGGHIYPAVSIINELIKKGADREKIFYVGNKKNLEFKIAKDNGFNFLSTSVFGMPRKLSPKFISWTFCLFISIIKCLFFILKYKPNVIFATGGYVCAPTLFAANILKVPYILHDSDCFPGVVSRTFSKNAKAVNLAFSEAKKYIKNKNIYNFNNPVRSSFFEMTKEEARKILNIENEFVILIMGGSQGAKSINEAAVDVIKHFKNKNDIKIILQTGKKNYDDVIKDLKIPNNTKIEPYFDNMAIPILAADLIISRAGSISISEILSAKNPSILVPYPYAAADHQRINARSIEDKKAAIYLEDEELKKGKLKEKIEEILNNKEEYNLLKQNAEILGANFKQANEKILNLILEAI